LLLAEDQLIQACRFRLESDFERTVTEAEAATALVPYDAFSHVDLADFITAAGKHERAAEWAADGLKRDPNAPDWWHNVLAFALYNAGRTEDALAALGRRKEPCNDCLIAAAMYARFGKLEAGRNVISTLRNKYANYTIQKEAAWPTGKRPQMKEPYLSAYLADLAKAGLPEK
jgi:adenylate cyclase